MGVVQGGVPMGKDWRDRAYKQLEELRELGDLETPIYVSDKGKVNFGKPPQEQRYAADLTFKSKRDYR